MLSVVCLAIMFLNAGCQTSKRSLFTTVGPGWRTFEGQALWKPNSDIPELGGEIVIATHEDGRCLVQFSKTPFPLVMAQTTKSDWLITFPPRDMAFAGKGSPPTRFLWLHLNRALTGQSLPASIRFQARADGWRLENSHSGESVEGFLQP
jgi:hypothetical protein